MHWKGWKHLAIGGGGQSILFLTTIFSVGTGLKGISEGNYQKAHSKLMCICIRTILVFN